MKNQVFYKQKPQRPDRAGQSSQWRDAQGSLEDICAAPCLINDVEMGAHGGVAMVASDTELLG